MKNFFFFKQSTCLLLTLGLTAALADGAVVRRSAANPSEPVTESDFEKSEIRHEGASTERFSVTLALPDFDFEKYMFAFCGFRNEYYNVDEPAFDPSGCTFMLPAGTYSFSALFIPNDSSRDCDVFVNHDNVEINSDCTLNFQISEATCTLDFVPLTPAGEEFLPPLQRRIPDTLDYEDLEKGNISDSFYSLSLMHKKFGAATQSMGRYYRILSADNDISQNHVSLMCNPLSSDWILQYHCIAISEDSGESFTTSFGLYPQESVTLTTDPKIYRKYDVSFDPAINGVYSFSLIEGYDNRPTSQTFIYGCPEPTILLNPGNTAEILNFNVAIVPGLTIKDEENYFEIISGVPITLKENTPWLESYPYMLDYLNNTFMYNPDGRRSLTPNPEFSHPAAGMTYAYGSSQPYFYLLPCLNEIEWSSNLNYTCMGFGGEVRKDAKAETDIEIMYEGKRLSLEGFSLEEWTSERFADMTENTGVYDFNFSYSTDKGSSILEVHFDTSSTSDMTPPVMTYLETVNPDGIPAISFDKPEDATLNMTAGDFTYNVDPTTYDTWMSYNEIPAVVLEYSPAGENSFESLPFSVVADKFFMPGYGAFYTAPVSGITRKSSNGYYDLRISLEDTAGNYTLQTLTNAIEIKSMASGIDEISSDLPQFGNKPVYYDLSGRRVDINDAIQSGIYIRVQQGRRAEKIIR